MIEFLNEIFSEFAQDLSSVLPTSPFRPLINRFADLPALGWINWFVPVGEAVAVSAAWLVAIGLFYLYSIALRWLKAID